MTPATPQHSCHWLAAAVFFVGFEGTFWTWGRWLYTCLAAETGVCTSNGWLIGLLGVILAIFCFGMFIRATAREVRAA